MPYSALPRPIQNLINNSLSRSKNVSVWLLFVNGRSSLVAELFRHEKTSLRRQKLVKKVIHSKSDCSSLSITSQANFMLGKSFFVCSLRKFVIWNFLSLWEFPNRKISINDIVWQVPGINLRVKLVDVYEA